MPDYFDQAVGTLKRLPELLRRQDPLREINASGVRTEARALEPLCFCALDIGIVLCGRELVSF